MSIYKLKNIQYLEYDIRDIFNRIDSIYEVNVSGKNIYVKSKMALNSDIHWSSRQSAEEFNTKIPFLKSLIKDIYSIIEAIYKNKNSFNPKELEIKFKKFKEFRLLNNKIKHFSDKEIDVEIVSINILGPPNSITYQEVAVRYKYKSGKIDMVNFSEFIAMFIKILKVNDVIGLRT